MSHLIAVHSFGRAAGRSTVTANLAALLAQAGFRVGLLDADFQAPSLYLFFGLPEREIDCTLNTFLKGRCSLEDAVYDLSGRVGLEAPGCLLLAPASASVDEIIEFLHVPYGAEVISQAVQRFEDSFDLDYLLVDTTPGLTEDTLLVLALADTLLVTLTPDANDYQGVAVSVDVARKLQVPRLLIVLNHALPNLDADQARDELAHCYECEVGAILPHSEPVATLASARLAAFELPRDPFIRSLRQLADQLIDSAPGGGSENDWRALSKNG